MSDQVHAATGNPLIPPHPEIQAQMAADGANPPQQPAAQAPAPSNDFDELAEIFGEPPAASSAQPQAQSQEPAAQPGAQQQTPTPQPGEPELSPEQLEAIARANAEGQQQPQQAQQQAPVDPAQAEQQAIAHLTDNVYTLTEDEAKQLISEPETVLPRLAARIHVGIAQQMGQIIGQYLPQQIETVVQNRVKAMRSEQEFYSKYPHLNNPKFKPVVAQSLKLAAMASPGATRDEIMENGALIAASKLKVQSRQQQQQTSPVAPPQAPPRPAMPFQPAIGGAVGQTPQAPADDNIFAQLADDPTW